MPTLSSSDLLGLSVQTESGEYLGRITGFDLDADQQQIVCYRVKSAQILAGLFRGQLLVRSDQVVSISRKEMVVVDSLLKEQKPLATKPQPL